MNLLLATGHGTQVRGWLSLLGISYSIAHIFHFLGKIHEEKTDTNKAKPSVPHGSIYQCKKLAFNI